MNNLKRLNIRLIQQHLLQPKNSALLTRHQYRNFSFESIARTQSEIFKTLSESTPVEYSQKLLLSVHDISGLPWWATIICTTALLRTCVTVPLALYQNYIIAKVENVNVEMGEIAKELKRETDVAVVMFKWDERTAKIQYRRSLKKQYDNLIIRDNCHPLKTTILLLFQIPLWVSVSVSLRNLVYMLPHQDVQAQLTYVELTCGGFGWLHNLVLPDSTFIFPVFFGLLNLAIIEIQALSKVRVPSKFQVYITNFFRGFSILLVPIAATVPSCLVLYWTTSSAFGLAQNLILMSPRVKRTFRIPQTPSELEKPYQHLVFNLKHKLKSVFNFKIT